MKPTICFFIILLLLYSCKNSNENNTTQNNTPKDSIKQKSTSPLKEKIIEDSITAFNVNGYWQLSLKFNVDSTGYLLKSIKVYAYNKLFQIIKANKEIENKTFELIDWNFDGNKDISVLWNSGSGGCAYWIWNYSKTDKKFYYNKELSGILGLEIDTVSKYIIEHYRAGYPEEKWDTLKYRNNKLTFIKGLYVERWTDCTKDSTCISWIKNTHTKVVNNKIITKIDSFITEKYSIRGK
ncbi:MAG: XAC2610-related protein [Bacteroidales bacterium]